MKLLPPPKRVGSKGRPYEIYIYTESRRSDFNFAGYAWTAIGTGIKIVKRIDGLEDAHLQFQAFRSVVNRLPEGAEAEIFSSSRWACNHFSGRHCFGDRMIRKLQNGIRGLIRERALKVHVTWVSRREN